MSTPAPGDQIHFLRSGVSFSTPGQSRAEISRRGQTITITSDLLEANTDRLGNCFFALDEEGQAAMYGVPIWAPGVAPEDILPTVPGTVDHDDARDEARRLAWLKDTPAAQQAALRDVERLYGKAPSGQHSSYVPGDEQRDRELREAGLKL